VVGGVSQRSLGFLVSVRARGKAGRSKKENEKKKEQGARGFAAYQNAPPFSAADRAKGVPGRGFLWLWLNAPRRSISGCAKWPDLWEGNRKGRIYPVVTGDTR